ncbi:CPBP family intramembrane metalloprotease [Streptomyces venezuelae]|uniref:CPBP family intramembrane metalloprotease n=1 Tax=Streptomyces venezuelae TaxID=54571 RepID=A0A5P2CDT8_STRVZ|nr:CPBP family intramembrane glutamic endopeptidase [Streptomyces venezuelae]QES40902.1 CPBP family intramembrane metalloprotease [Streptomyces venezuelae]
MTISPDFSAASTAVTAVLAAYLLLGEPWAGRRMYESLARRRDTEPRALVRYFGLVLTLWWAFAALAVAALLLSPGTDAADFGLAMPDRPVYAVTAVLLAGAIAVTSGRNFRALAEQGKNVPGLASIEAMLPRTEQERRLAIAVAVTDGIGAELVYRGLLIAFGVGALGLDPYVAAAFSVLVYAVAGFYQGRRGVLAFAFFGVVFAGLYLASGSLLLPVAVHVFLSVRDLTLPAPEKLRAAPEAAV